MGGIIKGKPVADKITEYLIKEVVELKSGGISPKLAIMRVGARADDLAYEKGALGRCNKIGIDVEVKEFAENISQDDFITELQNYWKGTRQDSRLILLRLSFLPGK